MKFWELTSAFREEKEMLELVLKNPKWEKYKSSYDDIHTLVANQNREILDEEIPYELAFEVCSKSNKTFWFYPDRKFQLLSGYQVDSNETVEILTAVDVLNRFGGNIIEEIHEKTYTEFYNSHKVP